MDIITVKNIALLIGIMLFIVLGVVIQSKIMTKEEQKNYSDSFDDFLHGDKHK